MTVRFLPSGDQCLVVEFGTTLSLEVNRRACGFARHFAAAAIEGIVDIVPAHTVVGLHYRAEQVRLRPGETPLAAIERAAGEVLAALPDESLDAVRTVELPVCYGGEHGPDLDALASRLGTTAAEVARLHAATIGHVLAIGFAPGLPYIGLWGDAFDVPRLATPRTKVPAGSVAVANGQTVIYPYELPGGWHLIGRTPLRLFDAQATRPGLLQPGDQVRFVPIDAQRFADWPEGGAR